MMPDQAKFSKKIVEYKKILAQDPKSLVFIPLAGCFLQSGLPDDALETALKGTWELPEYAPGYVAVARLYAKRKVYKKALSSFQHAVVLDPSCLDAYKGMASIYRLQGELEAASNLLTKAAFLFPEEQSLKQMLESIASAASSPASGPVAAATAQEPSKMEPITTGTIAEIYIKQGLYDKALEVYRELYTETNDPTVAKKIAEIEAMARSKAPQAATTAPTAEPASPTVTDPVSATSASGRKSGESVLETLNSMLASIQARRNRV